VVSAAVSISSLPHADSVSAAASATAAIALRRNAFINLSFELGLRGGKARSSGDLLRVENGHPK
jgi:hypothetical protein